MTIYTIVDEGYDVVVATSIKKVTEGVMYDGAMYLDDCNSDDRRVVTEQSMRKELSESRIARVYTEDGNDWKYRVEAHSI